MLRVLLAKDLRRVWRNPFPALINIALPLCITAMIGLAFGGKSESELGRIRFAVVDEDQSVLSQMLRGGINQREGAKYLDPVFVSREEALRQINKNELSAAVIIPTNFARDYLKGKTNLQVEVVKNPTQAMQPAVMEQLAGIVVTALNAISRNFEAAFSGWDSALENDLDQHQIARLIEDAGNRIEAKKKFIYPPLVSYEKAERAIEINKTNAETNNAAISRSSVSAIGKGGTVASEQESKASITANQTALTNATVATSGSTAKPKTDSFISKVFAWVLIGLAAMFLLFLANIAMTDLQRELRIRTFERYQTLHQNLLPFVVSKVIFTVVFLLVCSVIILGFGGLVFRVHWQQPFILSALFAAYACCAAGIMALLVALVPDEKRSGPINSIVGMLLGIAGGCTFPAEQLPALMRNHITPMLPTHWLVATMHVVQDGGATAWVGVAAKLLGLSAVLIVLAVIIFQRRFRTGLRT